jgi:D-inositol-3-phosphate glycosyltransferase
MTTLARSDLFDVKLLSLATAVLDDCSTRVFSPSSWAQGVKTSERNWCGMPFTHVGASLVDFEWRRYRPRKALSDLLIDCGVVQVVCGSPCWANAVAGTHAPVSLQVASRAKVERRRRDASPEGPLGLWRKAMTAVADRLDDRALRAVDAIQVENPWMLAYSKGLNADRPDVDIRYAPPGVDTKHFHPLAARRALAKPYILCVGRLDDLRKNISLLLTAFSRLPDRLSHVQLVTAGSAPPPPDYWAQVAAMGLEKRVRHVPRPETDELVKLYQQAAVFALPSDEEGLGVVILEAMACGVPVVATRCGGPEGIVTDGSDGYLVPLDDAQAMADRLAVLCGDTAFNERMGRQARATIESRYADEVAGQAFIDVWRTLLQSTGKH